jgi:hypothetical protein
MKFTTNTSALTDSGLSEFHAAIPCKSVKVSAMVGHNLYRT